MRLIHSVGPISYISVVDGIASYSKMCDEIVSHLSMHDDTYNSYSSIIMDGILINCMHSFTLGAYQRAQQ